MKTTKILMWTLLCANNYYFKITANNTGKGIEMIRYDCFLFYFFSSFLLSLSRSSLSSVSFYRFYTICFFFFLLLLLKGAHHTIYTLEKKNFVSLFREKKIIRFVLLETTTMNETRTRLLDCGYHMNQKYCESKKKTTTAQLTRCCARCGMNEYSELLVTEVKTFWQVAELETVECSTVL